MANSPYTDIKSVYDAKVGWNQATTDEERQMYSDRANAARKNLETNGYGAIANQISASGADADAVKKIMEQHAPPPNTTWSKYGKTATRDYLYSLGKSRGMSQGDINKLIGWDNDTNEVTFGGKKIGKPDAVVDGVSYWSDTSALDNAFNDYVIRTSGLEDKNNIETNTKINQLWGIQNSDREMMTGKYNKLEDTAYANPFETAEGKAILGKYDLAAMQGRDNAVASGGSSNGGNIDSYAAANALRQQAALTAQGQMVALDAHTNKINNVKGILADLGVYLQNQDKGMQTTIGLQQTEGQRLFENDQTAKNNETARLVEQSKVTGYVPNAWTIQNNDTFNQFLNPDGTFKKEMENVDIQALINSAKASGDTKTANDLAVVRARKMLGNYGEFGKYINEGDVAFMSPARTADYDLTVKQLDTSERIADSNNASQEKIASSNNELERYKIDKEVSANLAIAEQEAALALAQLQAAAAEGDYAAGEFNGFLATWDEKDIGPRSFLADVLWKDYINNGITPKAEDLKNMLINNADKYNIDVEDAKIICDWFDYPTGWLSGFVDRDSADDVVEDGILTKKGIHRGMKPKTN